MKTKKVNRYYCGYCKKSGGSSYWMQKHESRCTLNPNRYCGYCHLLDEEQTNLNELIALLPNPTDYEKRDEFGLVSYIGLDKATNEAILKIRDIANCPACIMAALRQKGIPVPIATDFNFKEECKSIWDDFNDANREF